MEETYLVRRLKHHGKELDKDIPNVFDVWEHMYGSEFGCSA